jgi:hypothetical protein
MHPCSTRPVDERLDALERLARLQQSGLLTPAELAAEKERILGGSGAPGAATPAIATPAAEPAPPAEPGRVGKAVRRHKWLFAGVAAGLLLTAFLVYLILARPAQSPAVGRGKAKPAEAAAVEPVAASGVDLADLLDGGPGTCAFGARLRSIVGELGATPRSRALSVPGFEAPITARVAELRPEGASSSAIALDLPISGQWHGLQVTRIRLVNWRESSIFSVQVQFSDLSERVRSRLNSAGFRLPETGRLRQFELGNVDGSIGVEALTNGTALTCASAQTTGNRTPDGDSAGNRVG